MGDEKTAPFSPLYNPSTSPIHPSLGQVSGNPLPALHTQAMVKYSREAVPIPPKPQNAAITQALLDLKKLDAQGKKVISIIKRGIRKVAKEVEGNPELAQVNFCIEKLKKINKDSPNPLLPPIIENLEAEQKRLSGS